MERMLTAIIAASIGFGVIAISEARAAEVEIVIGVLAEDDCESTVLDEDEIEYALTDYVPNDKTGGQCHYVPVIECGGDNECETLFPE